MKDKDIQSIVGWVLRAGVMASMAVVIVGGIIFLYRHGGSAANYSVFKGQPDFVKSGGIFSGIFAGHGRSIIQAGIILLIATPVVRVAISALGFIAEKDYLYTAITLVVLGIIITSMITGHGG